MKEYTKIVVDGTGSDLVLELGFIPGKLLITNTITRTKLAFDSLDEENVLGIAIAAAGTSTKASNGVVVNIGGEGVSEGVILAGGATVNVAGNALIVEAYAE